jgi:LPS sulfotransferase NodH
LLLPPLKNRDLTRIPREMRKLAVRRRFQPAADALARGVLRLRSWDGTCNYRKFVIIGIARTGSTLLINLLNSHSQILAFGELFRYHDTVEWDVPPFNTYHNPRVNSLYRDDPLAFLGKHVFRRWPKEYRAVGFKLFYYHARKPPHSLVWDHLSSTPSIQILHIKRRNILAQYYSLQLAHKTNVWINNAGISVDDEPPMRLEVEACRKHFAWVRKLENECAEFFKYRRVHDIYYEDLITDQERKMAAIQEILELKYEPVTAKLTRQRKKPLSQTITNYVELKEAFKNTAWAEFFADSLD